jgi:hypothetical protein
MPTPTTYYLNGPSLGSSTAIYTDASLTTCAPDGFYSDGTIVREQAGCTLLPQQTCSSCGVECSNTVPIDTASTGVFVINFEAGSALGAVLLRFNPFGLPDGIKVEYNGITYNLFSSIAFGPLVAPTGTPIFLGAISDDCIIAGSPYTVDEYVYSGGLFNPTGNTQTITVDAAQKALTATPPLNCILVIPKTSSSASLITVTTYGLCDNTLSSLAIACPVLLNQFNASGAYDTSSELCSDMPDENFPYFIAPVTGDGVSPSVFDFVFTDAYGEGVIPDGYYKASLVLPGGNTWFRTQNSVIVEMGVCP